MDLKLVRENAAAATTEDLLDRVTVYRAGMDSAALAVLEQVLKSRDVTDDEIRAHAERREGEVMWERPGLAWSCAFCDRPAVGWTLHWQRVFFGMVPLFPRHVRCCREHIE